MQDLIGKIIEPTRRSDDLMWDVNSGMRMRVLSVRNLGDGCYALDVDLTEFVEYNKPFLQHNFYDHGGIPRLNVYEAGMIKDDHRDTLYIDEGMQEKMIKIIEE